jgi:hypothetical protein
MVAISKNQIKQNKNKKSPIYTAGEPNQEKQK